MIDLLRVLDKYKDDKIAIYGLSTETERVLDEIGQNFQILGLLDGYKEEGTLYGKPIISMKEAVAQRVKLILVVARPGSCRAIAKRIGITCMENGIDLIDVRGKDLCAYQNIVFHFRNAEGISRKFLMELIRESGVVSIDLFDTLIMRQTLFSTDIFEIVDYKLQERGIVIKDFSSRRLESEKHLARFTEPTLVEIYSYMKNTYSIPEIAPEELADLEWITDYELVVPRQEMCDIIETAYNLGKDVYIVSDTFYSREQLIKILEKCSIRSYTDIFVSCEYKTSKAGNLFNLVKEKGYGRQCLHIGDDIVADIESAVEHGFVACQIYSGIDLLELVGYLGFWEHIRTLSDRIKVGMFVAELFNSPFQFEDQERRLRLKNAFVLGYLLFAPMIGDFVLWFEEQARKYDLKNLWFSARDGYLIKKMYDELTGREISIYFLTSRTAAIRAGVEDKRDIKYVSEMKYSGTIEEQLWERFGISGRIELADCSEDSWTLEPFSSIILEKAAVDREKYQKYINKLPIKRGDIAFFDFVAKGTSQMYIQRLVNYHLKGLYFLRLEEGSMQDKGLDILSFYDEKKLENSAIYENYYVLEAVLTSPMPTIYEFDEEGAPCYARETRRKEDILCVQEVQEGIFTHFKKYLSICPEPARKVNREIDEAFLILLHGMEIGDKRFEQLRVEDPFFHRNTNIKDLL